MLLLVHFLFSFRRVSPFPVPDVTSVGHGLETLAFMLLPPSHNPPMLSQRRVGLFLERGSSVRTGKRLTLPESMQQCIALTRTRDRKCRSVFPTKNCLKAELQPPILNRYSVRLQQLHIPQTAYLTPTYIPQTAHLNPAYNRLHICTPAYLPTNKVCVRACVVGSNILIRCLFFISFT